MGGSFNYTRNAVHVTTKYISKLGFRGETGIKSHSLKNDKDKKDFSFFFLVKRCLFSNGLHGNNIIYTVECTFLVDICGKFEHFVNSVLVYVSR